MVKEERILSRDRELARNSGQRKICVSFEMQPLSLIEFSGRGS